MPITGEYHVLNSLVDIPGVGPQTRYSGNDLTPAKRAELENFAKAGNPVVVANGIADRTGELPAVKLEGKASATVNSDGTVKLNVVPSVPMPSDVKLTYQWTSKDVTGNITS
ncbi:MAG: hypothetical protein RSD32_09625, partial [Oscillospiraceae bacterium]